MLDRTPIGDLCLGKWRGILTSLGVESKYLTGKHGPCFMCGGKDRFRWSNHKDTGAYFCSKCGSGTGVDFVMNYFQTDFKGALAKIKPIIGVVNQDRKPTMDVAKNIEQMRAVWSLGVQIVEGDPVHRYLKNRRIDHIPGQNCVRYVPRLKYDDSHVGPAMVAKITAPDGTAANVHRTWLTADGRKADLEPCRKVMRGEIPAGSAIRFWAASSIMGIAEGIETALRASQKFNMPVWSVVNELGMQKFRPPENVTELVIFGDADFSYTGQAAAFLSAKEILVHRQRLKQDIKITVEIPKKLGTDWADDENK